MFNMNEHRVELKCANCLNNSNDVHAPESGVSLTTLVTTLKV